MTKCEQQLAQAKEEILTLKIRVTALTGQVSGYRKALDDVREREIQKNNRV